MNPLEIKYNDITTKVELLERTNNKIKIAIDDKILDVDATKIGRNVYSILIDNDSFNVELIRTSNNKKFVVNTLFKTINIEIIDLESKYLNNRNRGGNDEHVEQLISPLPGVVVKINVKPGDHLPSGNTAIVIESMKMFSEFKLNKDRIVKEILVKEGETVDTNQPLIIFE